MIYNNYCIFRLLDTPYASFKSKDVQTNAPIIQALARREVGTGRYLLGPLAQLCLEISGAVMPNCRTLSVQKMKDVISHVHHMEVIENVLQRWFFNLLFESNFAWSTGLAVYVYSIYVYVSTFNMGWTDAVVNFDLYVKNAWCQLVWSFDGLRLKNRTQIQLALLGPKQLYRVWSTERNSRF